MSYYIMQAAALEAVQVLILEESDTIKVDRPSSKMPQQVFAITWPSLTACPQCGWEHWRCIGFGRKGRKGIPSYQRRKCRYCSFHWNIDPWIEIIYNGERQFIPVTELTPSM